MLRVRHPSVPVDKDKMSFGVLHASQLGIEAANRLEG
jgi:hypothetical protein